MFELVFHNGKSLQYRSCDSYDYDFDDLLYLIDSLGLSFSLYFNKHEIDYPFDLKKLCRFVS